MEKVIKSKRRRKSYYPLPDYSTSGHLRGSTTTTKRTKRPNAKGAVKNNNLPGIPESASKSATFNYPKKSSAFNSFNIEQQSKKNSRSNANIQKLMKRNIGFFKNPLNKPGSMKRTKKRARSASPKPHTKKASKELMPPPQAQDKDCKNKIKLCEEKVELLQHEIDQLKQQQQPPPQKEKAPIRPPMNFLGELSKKTKRIEESGDEPSRIDEQPVKRPKLGMMDNIFAEMKKKSLKSVGEPTTGKKKSALGITDEDLGGLLSGLKKTKSRPKFERKETPMEKELREKLERRNARQKQHDTASISIF